MTRIDFYLLPDVELHNRLLLICKLAEKAARQQSPVFIHAENPELLETLDTELWQFRADSFVAHRLMAEQEISANSDADPVLLSCGDPADDRRTLINLADQVPSFFSRFERTLEVVNQHPSTRDLGRERYKFYKERGYPLKYHKM